MKTATVGGVLAIALAAAGNHSGSPASNRVASAALPAGRT